MFFKKRSPPPLFESSSIGFLNPPPVFRMLTVYFLWKIVPFLRKLSSSALKLFSVRFCKALKTIVSCLVCFVDGSVILFAELLTLILMALISFPCFIRRGLRIKLVLLLISFIAGFIIFWHSTLFFFITTKISSKKLSKQINGKWLCKA